MWATSNGAPLAIDYKSIELNDHPYYSWYLNAIMGSCQLKCIFFNPNRSLGFLCVVRQREIL